MGNREYVSGSGSGIVSGVCNVGLVKSGSGREVGCGCGEGAVFMKEVGRKTS